MQLYLYNINLYIYHNRYINSTSWNPLRFAWNFKLHFFIENFLIDTIYFSLQYELDDDEKEKQH